MPIYIESRGIAFPGNPAARHEYLVYVPDGEELNYSAWKTIGAFPTNGGLDGFGSGSLLDATFVNFQFGNFEAFFSRILDDLVINRMDGNEEIASRVMTDDLFRELTQKHLARKVYDNIKRQREH